LKSDKNRALSKEDLILWNQVKRTFDKISNPQQKINKEMVLNKNEPNLYQKDIFHDSKLVQTQSTQNPKNSPNILFRSTNIDKKTYNFLKKGKIDPENILDLHGLNTKKAENNSINFIEQNYSRGKRLILIITGKGKQSNKADSSNYNNSGIGILKKSLVTWIENSEVRSSIIGIYPAHDKHGGGGAFYVYLRKKR